MLNQYIKQQLTIQTSNKLVYISPWGFLHLNILCGSPSVGSLSPCNWTKKVDGSFLELYFWGVCCSCHGAPFVLFCFARAAVVRNVLFILQEISSTDSFKAQGSWPRKDPFVVCLHFTEVCFWVDGSTKRKCQETCRKSFFIQPLGVTATSMHFFPNGTVFLFT